MTLKTPSSLRAFGQQGRLPDVVVRRDRNAAQGRYRLIPITSAAFDWFDHWVAPSERWWDGGLVVPQRDLPQQIATLVGARLTVTSVFEHVGTASG